MDDITENRAIRGLVDLGQLALRHQGEDVALLRLAILHVCPRVINAHQNSQVGDIIGAFGKRKQIAAPERALSIGLFACRIASTVLTPGMAEQDHDKSGRVCVLNQLQAPVMRWVNSSADRGCSGSRWRARADGVRAEAGRGGSLACPHAGFSEFRREPLGERLRTFLSFTRAHWPK